MDAEIGSLHRRMTKATSDDARRLGARRANLEEAQRQLPAISAALYAHFGHAVPVPASNIDLPGLVAVGGFAVLDPMQSHAPPVSNVLALAFRSEARPEAEKCRLLRFRADLRLLAGLVVGGVDCRDVEEIHCGSPHACSAALLSEFAGILELET